MTFKIIAEELEKAERNGELFSTKKISHFFIINLNKFPNWDTLLIRLAYMFRKDTQKSSKEGK